MEIIDVTIQGQRPILFNRMTDAQLLNLWTKEKKDKNAARPEPRAHAESRLYLTQDASKTPYIPVKMMMACLIGGGRSVRLEGKKMVSTAKETRLSGYLQIIDNFIPIIRLDGKPPVWETDVQLGRNPNGGEAVCIIRPRFDVWAAKLTIKVNTLPDQIFREVFDYAGTVQGLGDFRPERKGTYGIFNVQCWERRGVEAEAAE